MEDVAIHLYRVFVVYYSEYYTVMKYSEYYIGIKI